MAQYLTTEILTKAAQLVYLGGSLKVYRLEDGQDTGVVLQLEERCGQEDSASVAAKSKPQPAGATSEQAASKDERNENNRYYYQQVKINISGSNTIISASLQ